MTSKRKQGQPLSARELDVLECAADGLSIEQTAARLEVTPQTVKFHRSNLMPKLSATSIAHAVGIGYRTGLLVNKAPADAMSLEDVALALSDLAANVQRIADVTQLVCFTGEMPGERFVLQCPPT